VEFVKQANHSVVEDLLKSINIILSFVSISHPKILERDF